MKIMQLDNRNMSDLEYLAEMGFEKVAVDANDVSDLSAAIKKRSVSLNPAGYFGFVSLMTGIFIGLSVFFTVYDPLPDFSFNGAVESASKEMPSENVAGTVVLDTVSIVQENFTRKTLVQKKLKDTTVAEVVSSPQTDSAIEIVALPMPSLGTDKIKEANIKYIPNAPVVYLHDIKITNYHILYFTRNKFISLNSRSGLAASYSNKEDYSWDGNILEPQNQYYLHEAIADAMLLFKKRNYNGCLNLLNEVARFSGNDINYKFYSGMCYYYKKNYNEAIKNLDACIVNANNVFLPEAEYYKALSLYESGNVAEALILFKKIAEEGEFYSEKARQFLKS